MARGLYERALALRGLVHVGQFAVTGEWHPRRLPLLADAVRNGPHDVVLDLGCGSAPILEHLAPRSYVGIDGHEPSLAEGQRRHAGAGRTFVLAEVSDLDLRPWRGADAVLLSSVCHHLPDAAVVALVRRILDEVAPGRLMVQDAEPTGPLRRLVTMLDDGDHLRTQYALESLLVQAAGAVELEWVYDNPLRSFRQFLYEVRTRGSTPG